MLNIKQYIANLIPSSRPISCLFRVGDLVKIKLKYNVELPYIHRGTYRIIEIKTNGTILLQGSSCMFRPEWLIYFGRDPSYTRSF